MDGLSHRTNIEDLEALFEKYGRIGDVYIPKVCSNNISIDRGRFCNKKQLSGLRSIMLTDSMLLLISYGTV